MVAVRSPGPRGGAAKKASRSRTATPSESGQHGKRVVFDAETWQAIDLLARDSMKDFQELADEAFADLLRKHGRPTDLKTALRRSAASAKP
jgi:hypothetical protein